MRKASIAEMNAFVAIAERASFARAATQLAEGRAAVDALVNLAEEVIADLIVVGDVGLDTVAGRLLGSVPATVARRARIDILIVHTAA